jgi:hydroxymethylglutaryl-CoA reductase (NADPH)
MPVIPSMLLKKLYERGSLKNNDRGFEFRLKNTLAPGTIVGLSRVQLDGRTLGPAHVSICTEKRCVPASEVTPQRPLDFGVNVLVTIQVEEEQLTSGPHRITVVPNTKEVGELEIEITDSIA